MTQPTDLAAELRRTQIVRDNLSQRLGAAIAENIELLVRIHDLENPAPEPVPVDNGHVAATV